MSIKQKKFLASYANCGNMTIAARDAEVSRSSHYSWLKDPDYKQAFAEAQEEACDRLLSEVWRRGVDGWEEPVIYQGNFCYPMGKNGKPSNKPLTIRKYDSNLLMFLIKGMCPQYRDSWKGELKHSGSISPSPNVDLSKLTDEQFAQLEQLLEAAGVTHGDAGWVNGSAGAESI